MYLQTCGSLQTTIKEEDRLASVIAEIDEDVRIVPRAAFIKTPTGNVISNRSFEGQYHIYKTTLGMCVCMCDKGEGGGGGGLQ